ncbi:DUF742 domain-containing protein [Actinacidiphila sp. bgisy144]|uniref:DUF742 domain-containing protein n=1 Tax=Actinacidiphila sp. bgisy144 TaxID=3413791 RepID=UPI003EB8E825
MTPSPGRTGTAEPVAEPTPREPRTYVVTGGRTRSRRVLGLETQVMPAGISAPAAVAEGAQVLLACRGRRSVSVAEVAAALRRPVWAAKILIDDLLDLGVLLLPRTAAAAPGSDVAVLRRVLEGLSRWS